MTPEQEEQVRRALAAAAGHEDGRPDQPRDGEGMPQEVVDRLEAVLAELTAPRRAAAAPDEASPPVDELAARRRRRPNVMAAAAAVSVIALAGAAVATGGFGGLGGTGQSDSTTAGGAARSEGSASKQRAAAPSGADASASPGGTGDRRALAPEAGPVPRLRSASLRADVQRLVDADRALTDTPRDGAQAPSPSTSCAAPPTRAADRLLAVRLDGQRAVLLLRPAKGGTREALVYSCDRPGVPVATTTVPAP